MAEEEYKLLPVFLEAAMVAEALDVDNYLFVADGLVGAVCQELVFLVVILSSHDLATTFLHLLLEKGFHYFMFDIFYFQLKDIFYK